MLSNEKRKKNTNKKIELDFYSQYNILKKLMSYQRSNFHNDLDSKEKKFHFQQI